MFFTSELLATRDSGFGLLWLAATLGPKSTFRKLPRRSVLTADISHLCDLIAEPVEPLALRLSSNLLVGAARVYKVKQEIFLSDVTTCFNSLKKVIQDMHLFATDAQLQMAQPTVKPTALTLEADLGGAFDMDFDHLVADWDEFLNIRGDDNSDGEFNPKASKKSKQKSKDKPKSLPLSGNPRTELYTLNESYDHLLTASFDASFLMNGTGADPSSSQAEGFDFGFDDGFFAASDGLDIGGGIGDELARELGEGWGAPVTLVDTDVHMDVDPPMEFRADIGIDNAEMNLDLDFGEVLTLDADAPPPAQNNVMGSSDKENWPPPSPPASPLTPPPHMSPGSFSRQLLSQDEQLDVASVNDSRNIPLPKKAKRVRLLLDSRTELTDEELKAARSQYLEEQEALRREVSLKKAAKETGQVIEDMIWGVPIGLDAQDLIDFWLENFKVQVEARSGAIYVDEYDRPMKKRKVLSQSPPLEHINMPPFGGDAVFEDVGIDLNMDENVDDWTRGRPTDVRNAPEHLWSSEEPGQARRVSRAPSGRGSNFGLEIGQQEVLGSQKSSLFPWDNAGPSSSGDDVGFQLGSDRFSIDPAEVRVRGSSRSQSRRESSLIQNHPGSTLGGIQFSPAGDAGEDFAFEVPGNDGTPTAESQQSDMNIITLERNSLNFLKYAKMQRQILPSSTALTFDHIVPRETSTRRVAAAGFYHCLVLATKDFMHVGQSESYGAVSIMFV